jgi:hypothetical protein
MRRAKNLVLTALVTSLMVGMTGSARAAEPNVSLVWRRSPAAASCISENTLARAVEQAVGRSVFAPAGGASLAIDGFAERDQAHGAWRATLSLSLSLPYGTPLGRRELSSPAPGCGPLGDMVTLAMALMIRDREALANSAAPAPAPPPADAVATSAVASVAREGVRRTWEATSDASATLSAGLFPNPATGIRLRGVVRSSRAPVFEVEAAFAVPSEARFDPQPQAGGRFYGAWLGGAVCPLEWSSPLWRWRVCGGGSIGVLFFRPFGTNVPGLQRRPLLLGRASTGLERSLGQSWFAVASAEIIVPAIRERFDIRESNPGMATHTLFGMTAVGVIGGLGIGRRF